MRLGNLPGEMNNYTYGLFPVRARKPRTREYRPDKPCLKVKKMGIDSCFSCPLRECTATGDKEE